MMIHDLVSMTASPPNKDHHERLRQSATKLETAFLDQMLKSAGFGAPQSAFGGGAGEEQFSSLLRTEQARQMAESGGIGLAKAIFDHLLEKRDGGKYV